MTAAARARRAGAPAAPARGVQLGHLRQRVWTLPPTARTALLTGDIGSGKSTLVDAVTTLLLPAHRIAYNKAAGAETRERTLRSYVLGYYKSERNEITGSRQAGRRCATARYVRVILGVFRNEGYDATVTLAQVFWIATTDARPAGPLLRHRRPAAVGRRRLRRLRHRHRHAAQAPRAPAGVRVHDGFPEYGKDFRRRLGIDSEQALELFHQTVSMKSVGNLNDFVRDHMLEPFDAASGRREHRRPFRGPHQGPRGGAAGPRAARRAHPAAGGLRRLRRGQRRDSSAQRAARAR